MLRAKTSQLSGLLRPTRSSGAAAAWLVVVLLYTSMGHAAVSSSGDISPVPPAGGGAVSGPFRIGNVDVGTMSITGGTPISNTGQAILGDTETGIGIVNMSGFGSDWTVSSVGADLTVALEGTGSLNLSDLAFLSVNDDLIVAAELDSSGEILIADLGTIVDVGDDATIGQRGQAIVEIVNGGRLVTDANIIGDDADGDGRVIVSDQLSMWRTFSTMTVADAGRGLLQIFDGGRVENTGGIVANLDGSSGTVEVAGLGALWQNSLNLTVGEFGHGTLLVSDGGRVVNGGGSALFLIGRQVGSIGLVEVRGLESLITVSSVEVGDSGDGRLHIVDGGRVNSGAATLGDNTTARGIALVDGSGSRWDISGGLDVGDLGQGHLTMSNGGIVRTSSTVRVGVGGQITLDGGRLEIDATTSLQSSGILEGNGTIQGLTVNNNLGGRIRAYDAASLVIDGRLDNNGLVDVQSGEFEVATEMNNVMAIDARDGAVLRFGGTGLNNAGGARLAATTGVVDVFGLVDNNAGAEIAVGGSAVAVFHDEVMNDGTIFVQPGGEVFMLEDLGFSPTSALSIALQAIDDNDPEAEPADRFGQVQISGTAALAGTLEISLLNGFTPAAGDMFQILTASEGRTGTFSTELLPALPGGLNWSVLYNPNSVVLSVIGQPVTGDYNGNGVVDAADFVVWRDTLGQSGELAADGNNSGSIDAGDYDVWRTNFGRTAGLETSGFATAAVPEPAGIVTVVPALLAWVVRRRSPPGTPISRAA